MAQERNLPATGRRLTEARNRGQVAKSTEVNTAIVLLFGFIGLRFLGGHIVNTLGEIVRFYPPTLVSSNSPSPAIAPSACLPFAPS